MNKAAGTFRTIDAAVNAAGAGILSSGTVRTRDLMQCLT